MKDGLYRVSTPYLCAGFVVEHGSISKCAPILKKNLNYWIKNAERVTMALIPLPQGMPTFDARQVEPAKLFEAIPAGWYNVKIIKSENKPSAKGGVYLELEFEVIDGEYANRRVWERLNVQNDNELAVKIAFQQLAALCNATNVQVLNDSSALHGIPVRAKLKVVPPRTVGDKTYEASNEIAQGGFESIQGSATTTAPPAWSPPAQAAAAPAPGWNPPSTTPPPWEKKPEAPPPVVTPPPVVVAAPPAPTATTYPPEAVAWAIANPTDPQAAPILAQLPRAPAPPATAPWAKQPVAPPQNGPQQPKAPWLKQ